MEPFTIGVTGASVALALMMLGAPMALVFLLVGAGGMIWFGGWEAARGAFMSIPFESMNNFDWSVIPLFIMMGLVLFETGIGPEIFAALRNWFGHLPGGLAIATTGACAAMGTFTGSGYACTAVMAKVAYPEMRKYGYQKTLSFGVIASSGTLAMIIPPSIMLVIYAILAEVSISEALIAGFIPGFLSAAIYGAMILIRIKLSPSLAQSLPLLPLRQRVTSLRYLIPAVITFLIIIIGIYEGIFTPSEAGGVGCLVVFAIAFIMKRVTWPKVRKVFLETARLSVLLLVILMTVRFFVLFLTYTGLTVGFIRLATVITSPSALLAGIIGITFILGMFVGSPLLYLTVPLMVPVIISAGYDPIWFGIIMIKMTEVGFISPPVAYGVFIAQGIIKEVPSGQAIKGVLPFLACDLITLALFIVFPQIILWLPSTMG